MARKTVSVTPRELQLRCGRILAALDEGKLDSARVMNRDCVRAVLISADRYEALIGKEFAQPKHSEELSLKTLMAIHKKLSG